LGRTLRLRQHEHLRGWLDEATASEIKEIQSFVAGIERDYDAVAAGFRLHWSKGQVEGNVNRLKTLKRQMYGRAGFELLRQRVLYRA
jgi:transposase